MNKQDHSEEHDGSRRPRKGVLLAVYLSFLITACDGGIFGTGDTANDDMDLTAADTAAPVNEEVSPGAAPTIPDSDTPATIPGISPTPGPETSDIETGGADFSNTEIGSAVTNPQVRVVNVSRQALSFVTASSSAPEPVIAPGTISAYVTAPLGESTIEILDSNNENSALYSIGPVNLGASTLTTLVIRNQNSNPLDSSVSVIPLRSTALINDSSMALVRVVLAATQIETATPVELSLQPVNENPGTANSEFADLSEDQLYSSYQLITAGDYILADGASFSATVSAVEGKVQTWVIHAPVNTWDVLTVIDSE